MVYRAVLMVVRLHRIKLHIHSHDTNKHCREVHKTNLFPESGSEVCVRLKMSRVSNASSSSRVLTKAENTNRQNYIK